MTRLGVILAVLVSGFAAVCATAQGVSADRLSRFNDQLQLLDSRAATQYEYSARLQPGSESDGTAGIPRYSGSYDGPLLEVARAAARRHGIPEDLFLRLVTQESGWNPQALSSAGAIGLAQLMPGTAERLGVDPQNTHQNLDGGARYLAQQYRRFGTWQLALAAYNAGPEAVEQYDGIPPYDETQAYVRAILGA